MKNMNMALGFLLALAVPVSAQGWQGDANVILAGKHMVYRDWAPTSHLGELGLQTNWGRTDWPVAIAADLLFAGRETDFFDGPFTRERVGTSELDLGARKLWQPAPHFRPYLGGGLAFITARIERTGPFASASDEDSSAGLWLGGGVSWLLGNSFNLGLDAKLSGSDVRLFGRNRAAGGLHLGLLAGYHWGG